MAVNLIELKHPEDFSRLIFQYRKRSGLSRNQLSTLSGVGKTAIFDIEHGKVTCQLETLYKILTVLNIKLLASGNFPLEDNQ